MKIKENLNREQRIMKPLKDLNLLDRFLFDEVMEDTQTAKDILEIILEKEISELSRNETEKEFRRADAYRSIRIDVFAVDSEGNVYDAEMQVRNTGNLPKRSRLYESHMNVSLMEQGEVDFNELNDVYVIVIAPFDLWGFGRYRYTFRMSCKEEPSLCLEDGACRIFLNTRGTNSDGVSQELIDFLHYVEDSSLSEEKAKTSEKISRIHNCVQKIKRSEEIGVKYMQRWEELVYAKEDGREEGREEGRQDQIEIILEFLEERGKVPEELEEKIWSQKQPDILRKWLKLSARVKSVEEFEEKM